MIIVVFIIISRNGFANFIHKKTTIKMKKINIIILFAFLPLVGFSQATKTLMEATNQFLNTLNADEMKKTVYDFKDSLRYKWTNLPVGMVPRPGIQYGSLSDKSRMAFHRVLSAMLSSQGYLKTTSIMQLDDILNTLYQQAFNDGKIDQKTLKMTQDLK